MSCGVSEQLSAMNGDRCLDSLFWFHHVYVLDGRPKYTHDKEMVLGKDLVVPREKEA